MGYFSNGDEGMFYEAEWCDTCLHNTERGCPVLRCHLSYNYEQKDGTPLKSVLSTLIPRSRDGLRNLKCRLHITEAERRGPRTDKRQVPLFKAED